MRQGLTIRDSKAVIRKYPTNNTQNQRMKRLKGRRYELVCDMKLLELEVDEFTPAVDFESDDQKQDEGEGCGPR